MASRYIWEEVNTIYNKIKALAKKQGITIEALENKCSLGRNTMIKWNDSMPAADKLARVAKVLGTTVEALLEEDDGKPIQETL